MEFGFTPEQVDLIKKTRVPWNADEEHIRLFLYHAEKYGLDPLTGEIVLEIRVSKSGDKKALIITTRDGYLKAAMKDPNYNGVNGGVAKEGDNFEINPTAGTLKHTFGAKRGKITAGWAVAKAKNRDPIMFIADFEEYMEANKSSYVWRDYPSAMIQKVAEIGAIKRQFNITGMVGAEEIATTSFNEEITPRKTDTEETPTNPAEAPTAPPAPAPAENEPPEETPTEPFGETKESPKSEKFILLLTEKPVLKGKTYTAQAVLYYPESENPITFKAPQKFGEILTSAEGRALEVTGKLKDDTLTATSVKIHEDKTEANGTEIGEAGDVVVLTSAPKDGKVPYKGEVIIRPWASCKYKNTEALVVGNALKTHKQGDMLNIKIADRIEKDGKLMIFVSEANKIEQKIS